jgi:cytosine deaminase
MDERRHERDRIGMEHALEQARIGRAQGGVPIGAALVGDGGTVLGAGHNRRIQDGSAIRHGETDALENAGRLPASAYRRSTMYTTLSPCDMCTGAILLYGIPRVVIGENRTFRGGEDLLRSRGVEVTNLDSPECVALMDAFIAERPDVWHEDIGQDGADDVAARHGPSVETLRAITDAFNRHDLDAIMAFFTEDAVFESPRGPEPWGRRFEGRAAVREGLAQRFIGIPDVHYGADEHFMAGDRGASEWTLTGTTTEGERIEVRGCDLWTFRDGLVTRKDSYWKIRT